MQALGLIETAGYATAVSAADAALKAANVKLIAIERVIGVSGLLGVTVQFSGDVAAVQSAVQAGKEEGERVGKVISSHVIPRAHSEVNEKLLPQFGQLDELDEAEGGQNSDQEKTSKEADSKGAGRAKTNKSKRATKSTKKGSKKSEQADDDAADSSQASNE